MTQRQAGKREDVERYNCAAVQFVLALGIVLLTLMTLLALLAIQVVVNM